MFNWFIISTLSLSIFAGQQPPNSWRGIVPLVSTRAQVEALVGSADFGKGYAQIYDT
jgi:hypothetical protein